MRQCHCCCRGGAQEVWRRPKPGSHRPSAPSPAGGGRGGGGGGGYDDAGDDADDADDADKNNDKNADKNANADGGDIKSASEDGAAGSQIIQSESPLATQEKSKSAKGSKAATESMAEALALTGRPQ